MKEIYKDRGEWNTMKVYISGSITNNEKYIEQFKRAEQWLKRNDYMPINPVPVIAPIADKLTHAEIMRVCYALIDLSDSIFVVGTDWQKSKGCLSEISYAKSIGKPVRFEAKQWAMRKAIKEQEERELPSNCFDCEYSANCAYGSKDNENTRAMGCPLGE